MKALDLEKAHWNERLYFVRQTGSHKIYKHETISGIIVIPFHGSEIYLRVQRPVFEKAN
ncbi:MAG: type II toxin-antitoxin system HicA family toxin [Saprospiraceae bacterium]|nr:type II toxin-antitoxin system HicA family toxin [Saprospiraceae bacterium]